MTPDQYGQLLDTLDRAVIYAFIGVIVWAVFKWPPQLCAESRGGCGAPRRSAGQPN